MKDIQLYMNSDILINTDFSLMPNFILFHFYFYIFIFLCLINPFKKHLRLINYDKNKAYQLRVVSHRAIHHRDL